MGFLGRFDQLRAQKHGVEFLRPSTLANGDAECEFIVKQTCRKENPQKRKSEDGLSTVLDKHTI